MSGSRGDGERVERVERLDAERTVEALWRETGVRLVVEGPCPGGQVGAAYVRWTDGHRSVLKWRPEVGISGVRSGPLAVVDALRATGYPAPATELAAQVGHAVILVQELLPGAKIDHLGHDLLDQALALNAAQSGALAGHPEIPAVTLNLSEDGQGYCLHEPLRRHSRRSRALEGRIAEVAADHPDDRLDGDDAVHFDYHPGNLLVTGGRITGVVDWDGAARGDRVLDLVTLRFGVHGMTSDAEVPRRLDALIGSLPEATVRRAWAHMSLRMVDWAIRHFAPSDVDHWLDLAERRTG
ncbi:phosphotransferase [Streptomyces sp. NPDC059398]|uniref:phosphotransferase n=1 Tax=Streptomyces sp. NPDC059398 TaxID=3346820 RepID=UPI0036A59451